MRYELCLTDMKLCIFVLGLVGMGRYMILSRIAIIDSRDNYIVRYCKYRPPKILHSYKKGGVIIEQGFSKWIPGTVGSLV